MGRVGRALKVEARVTEAQLARKQSVNSLGLTQPAADVTLLGIATRHFSSHSDSRRCCSVEAVEKSVHAT